MSRVSTEEWTATMTLDAVDGISELFHAPASYGLSCGMVRLVYMDVLDQTTPNYDFGRTIQTAVTR